MKGLLMKDLLVIQKKYGITRIIMDIFIIVALMLFLKGTGAIYISLLLIPVEIMTMIISLTTCDEQWKWGKYVVALPVSKTTIVKSRYIVALIMTCIGFGVALLVNTITYFIFPQFAFGYYMFIACASFAVTLVFLSFVLPSNYSLVVNAGFAVMFTLVIILVVFLYVVMWILVKGPSETAKNQFVCAVNESSAMGFLANLYLSKSEIKQIASSNLLQELDDGEVSDSGVETIWCRSIRNWGGKL